MRKRDNMDYRKVTARLDAWESASLSDAGERELDDAVSIFESDPSVRREFLSRHPEYSDALGLYIELKEAMRGATAVCVPDSDYESLAADSDEFISGLDAKDRIRKRGELWRIAALGAAAACAAMAVVTAWMDFIPRTPDARQNVGMATVISTDTVRATPREQYARQEISMQGKPEIAEHSMNKIASASIWKPVERKQTSRSDVPTWRDDASVQDGMDAEEAAAWRMFMAAREEMAEVVKPDMVGVVWNDVPDLTGQNVTSNDINLPVGIYESLETAGEMFNSIYSGQ